MFQHDSEYVFPWNHPDVKKAVIRRDYLEVVVNRRYSPKYLLLPYAFKFICDLSKVYVDRINSMQVIETKGLKIFVPDNTERIQIQTRNWVKKFFSKDIQLTLSIYRKSYAGPASILYDLLKYMPISTFRRIFYTFFRRDYKLGARGKFVHFKPLLLSALITNRLNEIKLIGSGKNVIRNPRIPPKIHSWASSVLLGLWSSDVRLTNMYGLGTMDANIKNLAKDLFKKCLGDVELHSDRGFEYRTFSNAVRNFHIAAGARPGIKTIVDPYVPTWIQRHSTYASGWFLGLFLGDGTSYLTKNTDYLRVEYSRSIDLLKKLLDDGFPASKARDIVSKIHSLVKKEGNFMSISNSYGLGINALRKYFNSALLWLKRTLPNFLNNEIHMLEKYLNIKPVLSIHRLYALKTGRVSIMWRLSINGFKAARFLNWIKISRIKKYGINKIDKAILELNKFLKKRNKVNQN